jgi:hypothetical protein
MAMASAERRGTGVCALETYRYPHPGRFKRGAGHLEAPGRARFGGGQPTGPSRNVRPMNRSESKRPIQRAGSGHRADGL